MRIRNGGGVRGVTPAAFVSEVQEFRQAARDASLTLAEKRLALVVGAPRLLMLTCVYCALVVGLLGLVAATAGLSR